ncbi:MAG: BamA/TamA family outer membrane protein [Reichenbachiella sp.]
MSTNLIAQEQDKTEVKKKKKVEWVGIPIPSYNEVQGFGGAITGGAFYSLNPKDTTLKSSSTLVYAFFTQNETWLTALLQEGYFNQNKYWFDVLMVFSNFKYQYYQPIPVLPEGGLNIGYNSDIVIFKLNFLRQIKSNLYGGLHTKISSFNTELDSLNILDPINEIPRPGSNNSKYVGLGFKFAYDSRDNPLNPKSGINTDLVSVFYGDKIGSDKTFSVVEGSFNYYWNFKPKHILASRLFFKVGFNDVPFEEQAILGFSGPTGKDVRGYSNGKYRANQLYDVQSEWRWNFYKNWGMILFGGLALVGDNSDELFENGVLPAIGTGIRFKAAADRDVNVGLDVAWGKEDFGIYFAISEAF